MKTIIIGLILTSSLSTFASDCRQLAGEFSCRIEGGFIPLKIVSEPTKKLLSLEMDGEKREFIVNEKRQNSKIDNTKYEAVCEGNQELVVDSYLKGEHIGSIKVFDNLRGELVYTVHNRDSTDVTYCTRIK
jgi:hypothetical protein